MAKKVITINADSSKPKYRQIIDSVQLAIERKSLVKEIKSRRSTRFAPIITLAATQSCWRLMN
jgi:hypothetical protein